MILRKSNRASLTVEAAAVLPLFAMALLALVSIIPMQQQAMDIQEEMFLNARDQAVRCTDEEYRQISVKRDLTALTGHFGLLSFPLERKCLVHTRSGYESGYFPDEEYVYITEDSEVYHRDRLCSHIRLSVRETSASLIPFLRNSDGAGYRPCRICHSSLSDGRLYITTDGDRFHNSITCSALTRTVTRIRLSEVKDRRCCSRCGR